MLKILTSLKKIILVVLSVNQVFVSLMAFLFMCALI